MVDMIDFILCDECGQKSPVYDGYVTLFRDELLAEGWWFIDVSPGYPQPNYAQIQRTLSFCSEACMKKWIGFNIEDRLTWEEKHAGS